MNETFPWGAILGVVIAIAFFWGLAWVLLWFLGVMTRWVSGAETSHTNRIENEDEVYHRYYDHR